MVSSMSHVHLFGWNYWEDLSSCPSVAHGGSLQQSTQNPNVARVVLVPVTNPHLPIKSCFIHAFCNEAVSPNNSGSLQEGVAPWPCMAPLHGPGRSAGHPWYRSKGSCAASLRRCLLALCRAASENGFGCARLFHRDLSRGD